MLEYEVELFDKYNDEYEDLHNDAYINDRKDEILEIDIQSKTGRICHIHAPVSRLSKIKLEEK